MLQRLSIRHVVLIASCDIEFEEGLCVLTGETGAGKSILLDALGLVLGGRGDAKLIRSGETSASVTAEFDVSGNQDVAAMLEELGLEEAEHLIIRRTLTGDGKTRCLVNDATVSVSGLRRLGELLVEIHGQHDQRGLLDPHSHLLVLDAYGKLETRRAKTTAAYRRWKEARDALYALQADIERAGKEQDYLQHIRRELAELQPQAGEEEQLTSQRTLMMQGEKFASTIADTLAELNTAVPVETALRTAQRILMRSNLQGAEQFAPTVEALERAQLEVQEVTSQLERLRETALYDPAKLEQIEERLFALKAAARKHQVSIAELPALLAEVEGKLDIAEGAQAEMKTVEQRVSVTRTAYMVEARALAEARGKAAQKLQSALVKELSPLKMQRTRFRVVQEELPESQWGSSGTDSVRFEAATNLGQDYAALHKIASGGELSRFMLAMKVVLSQAGSMPTFIFDEVDTGTGGAVADAIGARLSLLADKAQVIVVTHAPQVAARGNHHLFIEKKEKAGQTFTKVTELSVEQRKEELARMLAGAQVTEEARNAASKLMHQAAG